MQIAGYNENGLTSCERYDVQKDFWREIKPISKPRTKFGVGSLQDGQIYVIGGKFPVK